MLETGQFAIVLKHEMLDWIIVGFSTGCRLGTETCARREREKEKREKEMRLPSAAVKTLPCHW